MKQEWRRRESALLAALVLGLALVLVACGTEEDDGDDPPEPAALETVIAPWLELELPDSLTGGSTGTSSLQGPGAQQVTPMGPQRMSVTSSNGCELDGAGGANPITDNLLLTRYVTAGTANWLCVVQKLADRVAELTWPGGVFVPLASFGGAIEDGPSAVRVTNSGGESRVELWWDADATAGTPPAVALAWQTASGVTTGRLVIDTTALPGSLVPGHAPTGLRTDFTIDGSERSVVILARFADDHWLKSLRVDVADPGPEAGSTTFDLGLNAYLDGRQPYAQWAGLDAVLEGQPLDHPTLQLYVVAASDGAGAARAKLADVLTLVGDGTPSAGWFQHTRTGRGYFDGSGAAEWRGRDVTAVSYLGGSGGASQEDAIDSTAGLTTGTTSNCAEKPTPGTCADDWLDPVMDATDLADGLQDSQDAEPDDDRQTAVTAPAYLAGTCPDGDGSGPCDLDEVYRVDFEL